MRIKERGTPERGIDRMLNEGGGGSALNDLLDRHLDEETPQNTDEVLLEDQLPEDADNPDDKKKAL
ncbi:hypothetical protein [Salinicoccus sp. HZC-1]|uniref:hypothetical protein n=1 Tax=Salinicoccus sp. HZC-1 TaxID=3385497 RepID=UPI00398A5B91